MSKPYQLFVANRSLTGLRSRPKAFKKVHPGFMPVFGKRPDGLPNQPAATSQRYGTPASATSASQCELPLFSSAESNEPAARGSQPAAELGRATGAQGAAAARPADTLREERFGWVRRVLAGGWWRRKARRGESQGEAVQGEFGLTTVRVVRNDLVDADIEVVPAGKGADAASERDGEGKRRCFSLVGRWLPRWVRRAPVPGHG